ncbi:serine/arginine-rich splicing factor 7-like isoform X6 [Oncorhynchus nerka]|uniref:serine/arginine-rich splicing factor 7-like isoform X6 n=1 Tax=Oncorhynchus nerka TaxID=8023 RepID=UPI001131088E|nr:serine/arginine-rich splicing factor 7-like isoform X5 [Oncorhynchus nerka]
MSRHGRNGGDTKVYVGNLGTGAGKGELERAFGYYGPLRTVWIARNPPGFAFVEFEDTRDAEDAVRGLDGKLISGSRVRVELSTGMPRRSRYERAPTNRPFDSNDKCYECGERGHYAYDCHRYSRRRRSRSRSLSRSGGRRYSRSRSRDRGRRSRSFSLRRSRSPRRSRALTPKRSRSRSKSRSRSRSLSRAKTRSGSPTRRYAEVLSLTPIFFHPFSSLNELWNSLTMHDKQQNETMKMLSIQFKRCRCMMVH